MKAPAFDYSRPATLAAVFSLLAEHGEGARLLAGGQTLLATRNMRLSEPSMLIDSGAIEALKGITVQRSGSAAVLRISALATHSEIEASALGSTRALAGDGCAAHRAPRDPQPGHLGRLDRLR